MEQNITPKSHKLILENRKKIILSGIKEAEEFDNNQVLLISLMGVLLIKGVDLKVKELNLDKGEVEITGTVNSITYSNENELKGKGTSIIKRMFK